MDARAEVRVSASPVILPSVESLPSVPSCCGDGLVCEETAAVAAPLGVVYSTCEARRKGKPVATNSDMDMSPDDAWTSREVPRDCADRGDSDGDSLGQCSPSPTSSLQFGDSETCGSSSDKGRGAKCGRRPRSASGSSIGDGGGAGGGPKKGRRACSEGEAAGAVASKKNRATSSPGKKSEARPAMQVTVHPPSQKRKERLRKLRQKREAVAQRKYALLPFTSSSDSSSDSDTDSDTGSTDSSTASSDGPSDVGDSSLGNLVPEQLVDGVDMSWELDQTGGNSNNDLSDKKKSFKCRENRKRKSPEDSTWIEQALQNMQREQRRKDLLQEETRKAEEEWLRHAEEERQRQRERFNALNEQLMSAVNNLAAALIARNPQ